MDEYDTVIDLQYKGTVKIDWEHIPSVVSRQFPSFEINAADAALANGAELEKMDYAHYFGNWKHDVAITSQKSPEDVATFQTRFLEPGEYRVSLDYAATDESKDREGVLEINGKEYRFLTLFTHADDQPIIFTRQSLGVFTVDKAGEVDIKVHPLASGAPLFWLRRVVIEPLS